MAHGTDDGKSITSIWQVQVGEQHVELFNRNESQASVPVAAALTSNWWLSKPS